MPYVSWERTLFAIRSALRAIGVPSVGDAWATDPIPARAFGKWFCVQSEHREGRQQLLSRQKQRPCVLDGLMYFVVGDNPGRPTGVLEFAAASPHGSKGPEPVAELGAKSHLDYIVSA